MNNIMLRIPAIILFHFLMAMLPVIFAQSFRPDWWVLPLLIALAYMHGAVAMVRIVKSLA